jgi:hypothetical protein
LLREFATQGQGIISMRASGNLMFAVTDCGEGIGWSAHEVSLPSFREYPAARDAIIVHAETADLRWTLGFMRREASPGTDLALALVPEGVIVRATLWGGSLEMRVRPGTSPTRPRGSGATASVRVTPEALARLVDRVRAPVVELRLATTSSSAVLRVRERRPYRGGGSTGVACTITRYAVVALAARSVEHGAASTDAARRAPPTTTRDPKDDNAQ